MQSELLAQYQLHLEKRGARRVDAFTGQIRRFLEFTGSRSLTDAETVKRYLDHLTKKRHMKSTSVIHITGVIRQLYKVNGLTWPLSPDDTPQYLGDNDSPALDPKLIQQMIMATATLPLPHRCFLALSTIYGLRQQEMQDLTPESLDRDLIHIPLAKSRVPGAERLHVIAPEIRPIIQAWHFQRHFPASGMHQLFTDIEKAVHFDHIYWVGWHAIRRTMVTLLIDAFGPEEGRSIVELYMGWATSSDQRMVNRYHRTEFVGREGVVTHTQKWRRQIDERIFEKHPFLPYWKAG